MILRLPAAERSGSRVRDLVQPHDLAATLLHAAGMPAAEVTALMPESQDLTALARGAMAAPRDHALTRGLRHRTGIRRSGTISTTAATSCRSTTPTRAAARRASCTTWIPTPAKPPTCGAPRSTPLRRADLTARLHATLVASEMHHVAGRGGTSWPPAKS